MKHLRPLYLESMVSEDGAIRCFDLVIFWFFHIMLTISRVNGYHIELQLFIYKSSIGVSLNLWGQQ